MGQGSRRHRRGMVVDARAGTSVLGKESEEELDSTKERNNVKDLSGASLGRCKGTMLEEEGTRSLVHGGGGHWHNGCGKERLLGGGEKKQRSDEES